MIVLSVLLFLGIISIHYYFNKNKILSKVYFLALIFKLFCGFLLYQLHLDFNILPDLIAYQTDLTYLSDYFWNDTFNYFKFLLTGKLNPAWYYTFAIEGERAIFFVRYLSFMHFLAAKNMYLTSLYSSLMAFWGLWACATTLANWFINKNDSTIKINKVKLALSIGFFFTPSVAFWASSMMKESFLWLIMGFLITFFLEIISFDYSNYKTNKFQFIGIIIKIFLLLILILCLFLLKYYYFALLVPLLFAFGISFLAKNYFHKSIRFQFFTFLISFSFVVGLASNLHPNLWFSRLSEAIFINQQNILADSDFDSQINFVYDYNFEPIYHNYKDGEYINFPTFFQLSEQSPKALLAGLFFPLEIDFSTLGTSSFNFYRFVSVVENWIILFFFIQTISLKKLFHTTRSLFLSTKYLEAQRHNCKTDSLAVLWLLGIIFCVGMATLLALSAPNLGSLVRYKIGFLPFFIFGIIMRLD
ncbi:hypothetical protein Fleli_0365 [Bernardetia litoralis DSM 6794]|uniref:Uncharacterized protein n=1 Tax=Bernardetia litoralis (strain ATCC 23117 / DSM 6794 / NBRC 15988 / NCIMB 1366 / Fx l1 / Sio-4) TaxID=880071 RepID=I4AFW0_BERLS|nr:hypothetical protein [Bernardetia litoralis]AFM02845.1 hypothetical protein Fleli_0365 [Bernardetia litoralis DSM 6794]